MKKRRKVNFKDTPKVDRKVHVSFTVGGERVSFTKVQKVPKRIGVKFFAKRRRYSPGFRDFMASLGEPIYHNEGRSSSRSEAS